MFNYEDIELELARTMREATIKVVEKIVLRQHGDAFIEVAREMRDDQLQQLEAA